MAGISATDLAILNAYEEETLVIEDRQSFLLGKSFWVMKDDSGTIEVHNSKGECEDRLNKILERVRS